MATFLEKNPIEKFSILPGEIEGVRQKAKDAMRDPDAAEKSFRKKLEIANALIQEAKREKMLESLRESTERMFAEQDN